MADQSQRRGYVEVAAELRTAILAGQLPPGVALPSEGRLTAQYDASRDVIRRALALLRAEGLITTVKGGSTYIRDRRPVRLTLSRYGRTLHPGPPGPFTAAAARDAGLNGTVHVVRVEHQPADADTAHRLGIAEGEEVVVRVRHMRLGDADPQTVQISTSTIPLSLVEGSPLAEDSATRIYASFTELGITPTVTTEEVAARMPTPAEAETLGLSPGMPVLDVHRVTRDNTQRPIELVRVVATADRLTLVYDDLPIRPE